MNEDTRHLTRQALHLLLSGEVANGRALAAQEHLSKCSRCRGRYEEIKQDLADLVEMDQRRLGGLFRNRIDDVVRQPSRSRRIAAVAAGISAIAAGGLLMDRVSPSLMASQQIDQAIAQQAAAPARDRYVLLKSAGMTCALRVGNPADRFRAALSRTPGFCRSVQESLDAMQWSPQDPISAAAFRNWRNSLKVKTDEVTERGALTIVRTSTDSGVLRAASLSLRKEDAHPIAGRLEPAQGPSIDLVEAEQTPDEFRRLDLEPELPTARRAAEQPIEAPIPPPPLPPDPDTSEVLARLALHHLRADGGYETAVLREGDRVAVVGIVADPVRRDQIATSLNGIPGVEVRVRAHGIDAEEGDDFAPPTPPVGDSPALAVRWLRQQFSAAADRTAYANRVLALARDLAGRAQVIEELENRLPSLASAARIDELLAVLQDHRRIFDEQRQELRTRLELVAGAMPDTTSPISLAQVQELRKALISIFALSEAGDSFAAEISRVRRFFEP